MNLLDRGSLVPRPRLGAHGVDDGPVLVES
jgi:hypothetical protein